MADDDGNHKAEPGKTCPKCRKWQRLAAYYTRVDGRPFSWCRRCSYRHGRPKYSVGRAYYLKHREEKLAAARERYRLHKDRIDGRSRVLAKRRRRKCAMLTEEIIEIVETARNRLADHGLLSGDYEGLVLRNDLKAVTAELEHRARQEREQCEPVSRETRRGG